MKLRGLPITENVEQFACSEQGIAWLLRGLPDTQWLRLCRKYHLMNQRSGARFNAAVTLMQARLRREGLTGELFRELLGR